MIRLVQVLLVTAGIAYTFKRIGTEKLNAIFYFAMAGMSEAWLKNIKWMNKILDFVFRPEIVWIGVAGTIIYSIVDLVLKSL